MFETDESLLSQAAKWYRGLTTDNKQCVSKYPGAKSLSESQAQPDGRTPRVASWNYALIANPESF